MNKSIQGNENSKTVVNRIKTFLSYLKYKLLEQFNKNIYTRILFTNVTVFITALIILTNFSNFMVTQSVYDQVQQDLLRKSKRVNYALTKEGVLNSNQPINEQELLKFLADSFDVMIIIFDQEGTILSSSQEQEVVPLSKVDSKFTKVLVSGETNVTQETDNETGQLTFSAVIPMGNNDETNQIVEKGILLRSQPKNLDLILNKMELIIIIGGITILIFVIVISVYLANCISRPISRLATNIAAFNGGNHILIGENNSLDEINDLTEQLRKLTMNLENIQSRSVKIEEERTRLFAEISHELRTPLTAVQGFTEAIRDGMVEDEMLQKKYLDMIYAQTIHITRLVDDILSLSRIESGDITVEKMPLDLAALTHGVVMSMENLAKVNNNTLLFNKKSDNTFIIGDVDRMEQIIRNLIKNSINATDNGLIKIEIESNNDEVQLVIEDNGMGIAPEELPHIWDRFYRGKNQRNSDLEIKGTGLGLVIVKKLAQMQEGKLDAESQIGKGTIFRLSFPLLKDPVKNFV